MTHPSTHWQQHNQTFLRLFEASTGVSPTWLGQYNLSGPRYTSYPTAPVWGEGPADPQAWATAIGQADQRPLALYLHLPFCEERCLFCSCNVIITQQKERAERYLTYLFKEIDLMVAATKATQQPVVQVHWGGGTPTYLSSDQLARLITKLKASFTFSPEAEIALEVDPRVTTAEQLAVLRQHGFNRLSMGVQDFDLAVQQAVHRVQSVAQTSALMAEARRLGFESINLDLIYGLPHQTPASFATTLETVIALAPERIALYSFAFVPWVSPHQNKLDEATLPSGVDKYELFRLATRHLLEAGYIYIGMDHFAKPTDELTQALYAGTLHRNFMGYTTRAGNATMLSMGVSAISALPTHYAQNVKKLSVYEAMLDADQLPVARAYALTPNDEQRRWVIQHLMCQTQVSKTAYQAHWQRSWQDDFAYEDDKLATMATQGLLTLDDDWVKLTPLGRLLSRNVAMVFDAHLAGHPANTTTRDEQAKPLFSKTL
jgi:oxygen-independent coproporphyrinogen-3 oxidase